MQTPEIVASLAPWREKHRRRAWKPIVQEGDGPTDASKFCGVPWIAAGAPWPACGRCHQPMQPFLQLNLGELPDELDGRFGAGFLQLFYCVRYECQGYGGWTPFEDIFSRVRVVQPDHGGKDAVVASAATGFPARRIVGWRPFLDLPDPEEHEELGLNYEYDFGEGTVRLECDELGLSFENIRESGLAEKISQSESGDKLAGWPRWSQGAEYPDCPLCQRPMALVFQLDSEDDIPFMFGDIGIGHVTQCAEHKEIVAFGWACS